MTNFQLSAEYKNESLSHATMREIDLIPLFTDFLIAVDLAYDGFTFDGKHIIESNRIQVRLQASEHGDIELSDRDKDDISWFLNETLFDILNEIAPNNCYFGAHPGDGSDYGFWEIEEI